MNPITCLDVLRAGQTEVRELLEENPDDRRAPNWVAEISRLARREPYAAWLDRMERKRAR